MRQRAIERAAYLARTSLAIQNPFQSAQRPAGRVFVAVIVIVTIGVLLGAAGVPRFRAFWLDTSLAFAAIGVMRALACLVPTSKAEPLMSNLPDAAPTWSILIALYHEADSVPSLLTAMAALEWPKEKLDLIFACEADDHETLAVLVAYQSQYRFRIVRVPAGGPRTKPNALQTALPFARGRFVSVYDAEDCPDPRQLRAAFEAFVTSSPELAVVQAPLVTWNHRESWISAQFALDYAIWFRVLLPAFARISGLLPLGGTSNHFRTDILRKVGGWDPYNVTEDADLGVRLARNGYRAALISLPTYEEAPPRVTAWVKQRGRWIQGHIQTFSVHWRQPILLAQQVGWRGLTAFVLGIGLGPMSALIVIPFLVGLPLCIAHSQALGVWILLGVSGISQIVCAFCACARDGRWSLLLSIPTQPVYFCLQALAACRAIWRVVFTPSIWDKTDHGCAARKVKPEWISRRP